jgi:hypothetical protein
MGLIDLIVSVSALSHPDQCQDQHLRFASSMSLRHCVMIAPPYVVRWINEHPQWLVVRWRCEHPGSREAI